MKFITGLIFGIVLTVSFYPIVTEAVEYYGKFPPTSAWQELETDDDATINVLVSQTFLNASSYKDKMWIISDGSLDIFFTEYP